MYRLFEQWAQNLSRGRFAILMGVISMLSVFAIGTLLEKITLYDAVILGVSMMIVYYFFDPVSNQ